MRDLLYKNLTSDDKRRKIIASSEISDKEGLRSIIRRHFVCLVKEVKDTKAVRPLPYLFVLKERNTREHRERFFCKIKGSIYAISGGRIFLLLFMHSLKIDLLSLPQNSVNYTQE